MTTHNMPDSKVLNRVIAQSVDEDFWHDSIEFNELRTSVMSDGNRIIVSEGASERWADVRALNFITLGLWDPQWTFDTLRSHAPNNADDLIDWDGDILVNAMKPQIREDYYEVARTRGFVKEIAALGATLANDDREENYTFRVYRILAQSETKLNIGTNPFGGARAFYGSLGPIRIETSESDELDEKREAESAAEADW